MLREHHEYRLNMWFADRDSSLSSLHELCWPVWTSQILCVLYNWQADRQVTRAFILFHHPFGEPDGVPV